MSGTTRNAVVTFGVNDQEARQKLEALGETGQRSLERVASAARNTAPQMQALTTATDGLGNVVGGLAARLGPAGAALSALGPAGIAAAAGLGGMTLALGAAVRAATEFETLGLRTEAVIRATGGAAGLTGDQIRDMSQRIARETLASTAGVEAAAAKLLTFRSVAGQTFERTLRAAQDLAATGFGSIESAAVQLGKALEDPAQGLSALSRSGVTFTTAQREVIQRLVETGEAAEAQRLILEAVERQVGGAGAAQAGGLAGAYDTLGQNVQEFLVRLGNLGPIQLATAAINTLAGAVGVLDAALARLSGTETPVVVAQRALRQAEVAVERSRGQSRFGSRGLRDGVASPEALAGLEQAQIALVAAEEESQRARTEAAIRGVEERQRAEREAITESLRQAREAREPRIAVEREYQTALARIRRGERLGLLDAAEAAREVAAATEDRARAMARLEQTSRGAARATRQQTDAERDLAREIERGVALVQQTQTEQEKYAQQLEQLQAALAAARITQEQFNRAVSELDPAQKAAREAAQRAAREAEQLARRQEQEAERTVDRITDFFGQSFARAFENTGGGFRSLMDSFRRAAISTFASIAAQAIIRPIIAPIFGASGIGGSLAGGLGGGAAGAGGIGGALNGGLGQILSGVGLGNALGGGGLFGSGGMFGGIGTSISNFLGQPLFNAPFGTPPSFYSADFIGATASPVSIGATLGAIGGIGAGAFGIYSGIQRGGIGGATTALGGGLGMAAGLATLTGIGASLAPILGPAGLLLGIVGSLLPGQRPSSRMQGVIAEFDGDSRQIGFDGAKFSASNRSQADQIAATIVAQEAALAQQLGFRAAGGFDLRVGDARGDGPGIEFRLGGSNYDNARRFENDEAGLRALSEYAAAELFRAFQETAADLSTDLASIVRNSASMETLTGNLEFFSGAYRALADVSGLTDRWTVQLRELNAPFDAAIQRAQQLGLSTQALAEAQAAVVADAQMRRGMQIAGIVAGIGAREKALAGDDLSARLQLFEVEAAQQMQQLRDALRDVGVTGAEAADLLLRNERILAEERLNIQRAFADAQMAEAQRVADAQRNQARSVVDWINAQRFGVNSSLTPFAQMQEAERQFAEAQASGDARELTRTADALLSTSRVVLGGATTAFAQRELFTLQTVANAGTRAAQASGDAEVISVLAQMVAQLTAEMTEVRKAVQRSADTAQRDSDRRAVA